MLASSYQDLISVSAQVKSLKHRKNLLLWYTADEPDGPGDPPAATRAAYDLIHELDGYHPVSIALNCADHFFEDYVSGADIILPDIYMIGNNVTFSAKYNTPCTKDFGCCGCDNCEGRFEDISKRLDEARTRLRILGWEKTKFIWAVTQAFGGEESVPFFCRVSKIYSLGVQILEPTADRKGVAGAGLTQHQSWSSR
jgi:hypothetical protein